MGETRLHFRLKPPRKIHNNEHSPVTLTHLSPLLLCSRDIAKWEEAEGRMKKTKIDRSINSKRLNGFSHLEFPFFFCPSRSESKMIFLLWCKTSIMLCVQQKKSKIKALPSPNWVTSKLLSQQLPHRLETDPCHRIKLINFAPSTVEWEKRWEGRENCDVSSKPSYVHSQQHKHTFFSGKS